MNAPGAHQDSSASSWITITVKVPIILLLLMYVPIVLWFFKDSAPQKPEVTGTPVKKELPPDTINVVKYVVVVDTVFIGIAPDSVVVPPVDTEPVLTSNSDTVFTTVQIIDRETVRQKLIQFESQLNYFSTDDQKIKTFTEFVAYIRETNQYHLLDSVIYPYALKYYKKLYKYSQKNDVSFDRDIGRLLSILNQGGKADLRYDRWKHDFIQWDMRIDYYAQVGIRNDTLQLVVN